MQPVSTRMIFLGNDSSFVYRSLTNIFQFYFKLLTVFGEVEFR